MGKFGSSSSSSKVVKKKKGPKGKQARAKAKLDRQWGEHVDEAVLQKSKQRKGKSRLLPHTPRVAKKTRVVHEEHEHEHDNEVVPYESSSDSSDTDESDIHPSQHQEHEEDEENALHSLLVNIQKKKKRQMKKLSFQQQDQEYDHDENEHEEEEDTDNDMDDDEDEDDASMNSSVSSTSDNDDDDQDNNDNDDTKGRNDDHNETPSSNFIDPFQQHFGQPPLTEKELETKMTTLQTQGIIHNKKPYHPPHLNEALSCVLVAVEDTTTLTKEKQQPQQSLEGVKQALKQSWKSVNKQVKRQNVDSSLTTNEDTILPHNKEGPFSPLQQTLWPHVQSYKDILVTAETPSNHTALTNVWALHVLNHVWTTRSRIQKHTRTIKESTNNNNHKGQQDQEDPDETIHRDQGFTRPTVLILLPTRGTCLKFVQRMVTLLKGTTDDNDNKDNQVVDGMERFEMEYGMPPSMTEEEEGDEDTDDKELKKKQRRKAVLQQKGKEWQDMFGDEVNDDDDFKIGMSLYPKKKGPASLRLYTDFYASDIIVTSPLALKSAVMVSSQQKNKKKNKARNNHKNNNNSREQQDMMMDDNDENNEDHDGEDDIDTDFLSSIEICLVLHSDVLLMQNWDHVNDSMELMNHLPKKNNDTDFSRVRNYLLAGHGVHWRQFIVCSAFLDPLITSTFERHSKCIAGKFKIRRRTLQQDDEEGNNGPTITNVLCKVKQVFQRVPCKSFAQQGHDRLQYFADTVLPQLMRLKKKHTLIYIPSYFDFVSLRNLLLKREANFVSVTEYARVSEVSRGRARFLQGKKQIMLYTGRAHFFQRHLIKGIRHIIFFGLPEHHEFYSGMLNTLNQGLEGGRIRSNDNDYDSNDIDMDLESPSSCLSLFTKYEAHALERIVGRKNCERMLKREKNAFIFCS